MFSSPWCSQQSLLSSKPKSTASASPWPLRSHSHIAPPSQIPESKPPSASSSAPANSIKSNKQCFKIKTQFDQNRINRLLLYLKRDRPDGALSGLTRQHWAVIFVLVGYEHSRRGAWAGEELTSGELREDGGGEEAGDEAEETEEEDGG